MKSSSRVVVNTLAQYVRTVLSLIIVLYTSRVVLANLGVSDYGIYSLVGGVVAMLAFVRTNLSRTIQRFLSYHHGSGDKEKVIAIFNNSVYTQIIISLGLCATLFLCTPLIFGHLLNIPEDRIPSAKIVYWLMLLNLMFSMLSSPYEAVLIARENIIFSSLVNILDAILKIPIALSLIYISQDKLEWYSLMMSMLVVLNFIVYRTYCRHKYGECRHFSFSSFKKSLFVEMFSFMGWNVYGSMCVTGRTQGVAILLNRFFSTAVNAAFGLGSHVAAQVNFLASALTTAINPQIIKAEGAGNRKRMFRLAEISCKFSFLLMNMLAVPSIICMDFLLDIWLKEVPQYTGMFCRMIILTALVDLTTLNLNTANQAVGNVKVYSIFVNTIKVMTLPVAWLVLWMGKSPFAAMVAYVSFEAVCAASRLIFLHININLSIKRYFVNVFAGITPVFLLNFLTCFAASRVLVGWLSLLVFVLSFLMTSASAWLIGLKDDERQTLVQLFSRISNKLRK